jgi:hypothetical protein
MQHDSDTSSPQQEQPIPMPSLRPALPAGQDQVTVATRLGAARDVTAAAKAEQFAALEEELARCVAEAYPGGAWLVVDLASWHRDPEGWNVEVRAVLAADGQPLDDYESPYFPMRPGTDQWIGDIGDLLTELAGMEATGNWPSVCADPAWGCGLRAVALTAQAYEAGCRFPHGHGDDDVE